VNHIQGERVNHIQGERVNHIQGERFNRIHAGSIVRGDMLAGLKLGSVSAWTCRYAGH
jgi:hypothetical protein